MIESMDVSLVFRAGVLGTAKTGGELEDLMVDHVVLEEC